MSEPTRYTNVDPHYTEIETQHGTYKVRSDIFDAAFEDYKATVEEMCGDIVGMNALELARLFFLCGCQCGDTLKWDKIYPGCADSLLVLRKKNQPEAG